MQPLVIVPNTWGRDIDEATYKLKSAELKSDASKAEEEIEKLNDLQTLDADWGLKLFDWSQNVAELWLGLNNRQKREILDLLCLYGAMSDVSLLLAKKTVRFFVRTAKMPVNRGDWTPLELFLGGIGVWNGGLKRLLDS